MKIEQELNYLGFTDNEIKVYLSLLKTSGNYVSNLARDTGIGRVNLYYTLDLLFKKKLVYGSNKNKAKFFVPEKPEKIINIFKEKLNAAESILPGLKMLENTGVDKPSFKYYEGIDGVKEVMKEIVGFEKIQSYANLESFFNNNKDILDEYFNKIVKNNISFNLILSYNEEIVNYMNKFSETYNKINYVFINPLEFPFKYDIFITDKIVGIISVVSGEIIALRIESKAYADSQKAIFNLAWLGATSFVV